MHVKFAEFYRNGVIEKCFPPHSPQEVVILVIYDGGRIDRNFSNVFITTVIITNMCIARGEAG